MAHEDRDHPKKKNNTDFVKIKSKINLVEKEEKEKQLMKIQYGQEKII